MLLILILGADQFYYRHTSYLLNKRICLQYSVFELMHACFEIHYLLI